MNAERCASTVEPYNLLMKEGVEKRDQEAKFAEHLCLNDGFKNNIAFKCDCSGEFIGEHCEISQCYNFCLNDGECAWEHEKAKAICSCKEGFNGKRCESNNTISPIVAIP